MPWLTQSWWKLLDPAPAAVALAACALVCGAIVGSERERRERPAGLRTLMLVCLGSAVFTMAGFAVTNTSGDASRVAAQIVTGIGFLGAGVIIREGRSISGTTTAATIWLMASIGMTIGAGHGAAGLALGFAARWILGLGRAYERRFIEHLRALHIEVVFQPDHGKTRAHLLRIITEFNVAESACAWSAIDEERHKLSFSLRLGHRSARELLGQIASLPAVVELEEKADAA